ncbi:GNAT family N-acetyltransferase [Clostridium perfringens]|uniref:GNAT family N-acetyltransferase n=1 Tax=Clostridium perfringens TaxID=1502 RepID=UPI0028E128E4|nr:GNAT family N-acetyltransferase [Clostridium perfringens]MDT9334749.1 GNAT family N-acetyltransferase [Clostridium perfringens]MDT9342510.1 GNAT family N-acetyltransferase [Clostridium perfringens]MDT9345689.1 GNAT family N-acetyltransferase [Clostridium perfringens]MDT9351593.1 GNAT family N-acetyltransferase [Clostridium perfringens]
MEKIKLILPNLNFKNEIEEYKNEFILNGDSMDGCAGLGNIESFEEWIQILKYNSNISTVREGFVPSSTYMAIRESDNRIVGMMDIRHFLNDYLEKFGGHIGYSVRKSERQKGYAKKMLELALEKCKELNINRVLLTCSKDNIPSMKTILSQGGILENEVLEGERITCRYWIDLK